MANSLGDVPPLRGVTTLGEQLRVAIEEAIVSGHLEAGARISADDLAEHFGVSRIPVREALRSLDASGWVDIRPRHGVYVRQREERELAELFEVRATLESQACELAALRRTDEEVAELEELARAGADALGDPRQFAAYNADFHAAVANLTRNEVLIATLSNLQKRVQWYFSAAPPNWTEKSANDHFDIVEAIKHGDSQRAAKLGEHHVTSTTTVLRVEVGMTSEEERPVAE